MTYTIMCRYPRSRTLPGRLVACGLRRKGGATTHGRTPNHSPLCSRAKVPIRKSSARRRMSEPKNANVVCLRVVESAHAELARKNIPGPYSPIVYRKANVAMTATPLQAATQRGGYEGKSVLVRGDAIHACVVKHILPVARRTYTHRESGINWMDVSAAVSAHVDALLTADPPLGKRIAICYLQLTMHGDGRAQRILTSSRRRHLPRTP